MASKRGTRSRSTRAAGDDDLEAHVTLRSKKDGTLLAQGRVDVAADGSIDVGQLVDDHDAEAAARGDAHP